MRIVFFSSVALLTVVACSSKSSSSSSFSKVIGPEGGTLDVTLDQDDELGGTELVIPAGALAAPTTVTISHGDPIAEGVSRSEMPDPRGLCARRVQGRAVQVSRSRPRPS